MKTPISIITPSYNQGEFIERTIDSVLSQNIDGVEHWIIDGASTDNTLNILQKYGSKISWISEKDRGQANAVNKGIQKARGEIIGWLNSDDVYYEEALRTVLDYFRAHPETEVVYGNAYHIDVNGRVIEPYYTEKWDYERLKIVCFICQPSVFFRKRIVDTVGLLDEKLQYCMDYEYWLRIGRIVPFIHIDKDFAGSRMYNENKTLRARVAVHQEINDMMKEKFGKVPSKWIYSYAHHLTSHLGLRRNTDAQNKKFVITLSAITLFSFLKWKQRPKAENFKLILEWLLGLYINTNKVRYLLR